MTKRGITGCILTLIMVAYLAISIVISNRMAAEAPCEGVVISVKENSMSRFVTPEDIDLELHNITSAADSMNASQFNLTAIEKALSKIDNIESANSYRRADDVIAIDVVPMIPVARVFAPGGSYYVNRSGKHLVANVRYQIDVPVIVGDFNGHEQDLPGVLGLIERINENDAWRALVSTYKISPNRDIMIVPTISGHYINFGDTLTIDDKFRRLSAFYSKVLPAKGWNYYDTISVKFAGQIVGHIAPGKRPGNTNEFKDEDYVEEIEVDAMVGETTSIDDIKPKLN